MRGLVRVRIKVMVTTSIAHARTCMVHALGLGSGLNTFSRNVDHGDRTWNEG